jgi:hypothetical protein
MGAGAPGAEDVSPADSAWISCGESTLPADFTCPSMTRAGVGRMRYLAMSRTSSTFSTVPSTPS